nr:hypothetical protein [Tanacetum cinerariifolium]
MTKKPLIPRRNKVNWHYVRDDILFSTIKVAAQKPKTSTRRKRGGSDSSTTPPTPIATPTPITTVVAAPRLSVAAKGKQPARATSPTNPSDVERTEAEQLKIILRRSRQETHISQQGGSSIDEGTDDDDDDNDDEEETAKIDEPKDTKSGGDDEETESSGESEEEETKEEAEEKETKEEAEESFDPIPRTPKDSEDDGNGEEDQDPLPLPTSTMTPSIITTTTTASQPLIPPTPIPSEVLQHLPTFESVFRFEDRVKSLEVNFSEFITIDDNMKKIIKEQIKSQVKAQVTGILPRIEESVNAQLEAEVLTRSSHSSRTSYAVAVDLSEMKLKKILIDKIEGNKSIQRSDEQRNLYKALEHASASTPSEPATRSAGRSTTGTQSRQMSASESTFAEEPVQTTC